MKKIIYSAIAVIAFVSVSIANTKENDANGIEVSTLDVKVENIDFKEILVVESNSDFAGFVCWLFSMRCVSVD